METNRTIRAPWPEEPPVALDIKGDVSASSFVLHHPSRHILEAWFALDPRQPSDQ